MGMVPTISPPPPMPITIALPEFLIISPSDLAAANFLLLIRLVKNHPDNLQDGQQVSTISTGEMAVNITI